MFTLSVSHEFDWPVRILKPVDGGAKVEERCTVRFRLMDEDVAAKLIQDGDFKGLLSEAIVGWAADVGDAHGQPLPFTPEHRASLVAIPYVREGLARAYLEATNGRELARKN